MYPTKGRARLVLSMCFVVTLGVMAQAQNWRKVEPPPALETHAMAYDSARDRVVLFGGRFQSHVSNTTWEFDGSAWTEIQTPTTPPARYKHSLVYDSQRGRIVLFGGSASTLFNDTWEYDGVTWTQISTAVAPPVRSDHAMSYDANTGRTVLFGGFNGVFLNDTWAYDGVNWSQVQATPPTARLQHAMVFDAGAGGSLLFGGFTSPFVYFSDTWVYDDRVQTWTPITTASAPPARSSHAMAFDSRRGRTVLFGGSTGVVLGDTWVYDHQTPAWTQVPTPTAPPARSAHALAYNARRGTIVLFSGAGTSPLGDTWTFDGSAWVLVSPGPVQPPTRSGHEMVYDGVRQRLVTFGGQRFAGSWIQMNDTWENDGRRWSRVLTPTSPPRRSWYGMAYDAARGRTVLYGGGRFLGNNNWANYNDTWEYDGTTWTQVPTTAAPNASLVYAMTYDSRRRRTVLFGGIRATGAGTFNGFNETWEYDGVDWTQVPTPTAPPARNANALAFDERRGVVVLFGGNRIAGGVVINLNDTWEYSGATWTQVLTGSAPSPRGVSTMTYDPARGRLVLYGGAQRNPNGTWRPLDDTWEYDGLNWTQVQVPSPPAPNSGFGMAHHGGLGRVIRFGGGTPAGAATNSETWVYEPVAQSGWTGYGTGCVGSGGIPVLMPAPGSQPNLGSSFNLNVTNLPSTAGQLFVANGFDIGQIGGLPLPLELGPMGLVGCTLWVGFEPGLSFGQSHPGNMAVVVLAIPNIPALAGMRVATQVLNIDPNAANGVGALSNAGIATVQ